MREIKYRIPHCNSSDGSFSHFTYWGYLDGGEPVFSPPMTYFTMSKKPDEQYTGIKDKNGIKIYEGDILSRNGESFEVVFYDSSWCTKSINWTFPFLDCDIKNYKIIGNIHENPELLNA